MNVELVTCELKRLRVPPKAKALMLRHHNKRKQAPIMCQVNYQLSSLRVLIGRNFTKSRQSSKPGCTPFVSMLLLVIITQYAALKGHEADAQDIVLMIQVVPLVQYQTMNAMNLNEKCSKFPARRVVLVDRGEHPTVGRPAALNPSC